MGKSTCFTYQISCNLNKYKITIEMKNLTSDEVLEVENTSKKFLEKKNYPFIEIYFFGSNNILGVISKSKSGIKRMSNLIFFLITPRKNFTIKSRKKAHFSQFFCTSCFMKLYVLPYLILRFILKFTTVIHGQEFVCITIWHTAYIQRLLRRIKNSHHV